MGSSRLVDVLSEFAATILNPFDLQALLHRLTGHAAELTGAQGAGIMLAGRREGGLGFAAASDERVLEMELIQDRIDSGACHEAFVVDELLVVEDLEGLGRWPEYEERAVQLGLRAVLAVPMNAWGQKIGVVNIYRERPGPWSADDIETGQIITGMGAGYVLHANQMQAQHELADQLRVALEGRDVIGQAKGFLMANRNIDADAAFEVLRKLSQDRNVKLRDVAREVISHGSASDIRSDENETQPAP